MKPFLIRVDYFDGSVGEHELSLPVSPRDCQDRLSVAKTVQMVGNATNDDRAVVRAVARDEGVEVLGSPRLFMVNEAYYFLVKGTLLRETHDHKHYMVELADEAWQTSSISSGAIYLPASVVEGQSRYFVEVLGG